MKTFAAILIFCVLGGTAARASSFVEPEEMNTALGPSMVARGGEAQAAEAESPSIVALGSESAPDPTVATLPVERSPHESGSTDGAATLVSISPSIVATEAAITGIDEARTAAIGEDDGMPKRGPHFKPMVIRGDITGDAFARSVQREAAAEADAGSETDTGAQAARTEERPDRSSSDRRRDPKRKLPPNGLHLRPGASL